MASKVTAMFQHRPKLFIAGFLALVVFALSTSTPSGTIKTHTQRLLKSTSFSTPYTFRGDGGVLPDAHRLRDADDFLPHFKAVVNLPGMAMVDAKATCGWPNDTEVNFQYNYDPERPADMDWVIHDKVDSELDLKRKQWQWYVANDMRPWAQYKNRFHGRGIVVPGGHKKSVHRLRVLLKALRRLGSRLPVEIAYYDDEMTDELKQELVQLGGEVYFNDLSRGDLVIPTYYSIISNFHLKIPAVVNSRFAEVLLMDSDNIPVMAPEELFESDTYKEYGTIFWPDVSRTRPNNPIWAITNTKCRMDEYEQESGQLLVDKRKFFYHLQLANWLEVEHHLYYTNMLLGDKDMFRFTWYALKTAFGKPARWVTSVGTVSPSDNGRSFYCGHSFAQHHPDPGGKPAFMHGGFLKTLSNAVIRWQLENQGGIFQAYKRVSTDERPEIPVKVRLEWDPAHYLSANKTEDYHTAWCTNFNDVEARSLEEVLPGFQDTYQEIGGYWMLDLE